MWTFLFWLLIVIGVMKLAYVIAVSKFLTRPEQADEIHSVRTEDGWHIRLLRHQTHGEPGEPVLLVHGLAGSPINFAPPGADGLAQQLTRAGFDCWAIDLRGNRGTKPPANTSLHAGTFDDYLRYDLPAALEFIREATGCQRVHWVGHSMGGLLLYSYLAWHGGDELASGVTLGSPTHFSERAQTWHQTLRKTGLLRLVELLPGPSAWYQHYFAPMIPLVKLPLTSGPINWDNADPRIDSVVFYNMLELAPPSVLKKLTYFAANNEFRIHGNRIDLFNSVERLQLPLLVVAGKLDPLATAGTLKDFVDQLPGDDKSLLVLSRENGAADYNHVDLLFGRQSETEVAAPIADWLRAHPVDAVRATPKTVRKTAARPIAAKEQRPSDTEAPDVGKAAERWSSALVDAAGILDNFGGADTGGKPGKSKIRRKKATSKKPAAKKTSAKKSSPKKKKVSKEKSSKPKAKAKKKSTVAAKKTTKPAKKSKKPSKTKPKKKSTSPKKAKKNKPVKKSKKKG